MNVANNDATSSNQAAASLAASLEQLTSGWTTSPGVPPEALTAARIPAVDATHNRPVFAATLLPIVAAPPSNLAEAQLEAEEYDDGFAQIAHSNQPQTVDTATLDPNQIAPGTDAGIQIRWDDEQVTRWLNNQVDLFARPHQGRPEWG